MDTIILTGRGDHKLPKRFFVQPDNRHKLLPSGY